MTTSDVMHAHDQGMYALATSLITASADYENTTADLMFGPSSRNQCVPIPLINNMVPEAPEHFRVLLGMVTPLPGIVLTPDIATVAISDDDGKCENEITVLECAVYYFNWDIRS